MEKTKSFLGVNKRVSKKSKKSCKKRLLINKVIDYLKFDHYMFAPLVSSPPSDILTINKISAYSYTGVEAALKPTEGKDVKLLSKVEEYLKSDVYMYAPIVDPQLFKVNPAIAPSKAATTKSPSHKVILKENQQPKKSTTKEIFGKGAQVQQNIALRETVKHIVHHNCRSSSAPGKKLPERRQRKLVE